MKRIADIREGIHLYRLGGQSPLGQFIKLAEDQYRQMKSEIEQGIAETFKSATITIDGIDLLKEGFKGPTSTWTYLVNDNPSEWLGPMTEIGNVGYGIAIGLYFGFVFILQALYRKLFRSKRFIETDRSR